MNDEIIFINENNVENKGYLLSKVKYKDKEYIIYTDNYRNEKNELRLLASRIEVINNKIYTYKINTKDEWDYIENIIQALGEF